MALANSESATHGCQIEVDFIVDWQATDKVYVIGVVGVLFPGKAAEQWVGGDDDWVYSMLYASYAF